MWQTSLVEYLVFHVRYFRGGTFTVTSNRHAAATLRNSFFSRTHFLPAVRKSFRTAFESIAVDRIVFHFLWEAWPSGTRPAALLTCSLCEWKLLETSLVSKIFSWYKWVMSVNNHYKKVCRKAHCSKVLVFSYIFFVQTSQNPRFCVCSKGKLSFDMLAKYGAWITRNLRGLWSSHRYWFGHSRSSAFPTLIPLYTFPLSPGLPSPTHFPKYWVPRIGLATTLWRADFAYESTMSSMVGPLPFPPGILVQLGILGSSYMWRLVLCTRPEEVGFLNDERNESRSRVYILVVL